MLLRIENLRKSYGSLLVTDDISLSVEEGEALGIIGPNGAGKTTLFSLITGAVPPNAGRSTSQERTSPGCRRSAAASPASAARTRCRIPSRS